MRIGNYLIRVGCVEFEKFAKSICVPNVITPQGKLKSILTISLFIVHIET